VKRATHTARKQTAPATARQNGRKIKPRATRVTKKARLTPQERLFNKAIESISKVPADQWLWNR